jgi:hypothetical protein
MFPTILQAARIVSPLQRIDHGIQAGAHQLTDMLTPSLCGFHNYLDVTPSKERLV